MSQLSCSVMFWPSCHLFPVKPSCHGCPVQLSCPVMLSVLSSFSCHRLSSHNCPAPSVLSSCPVLAVLSLLLSPLASPRPVPVVLSGLSYTDCSALAFPFWLLCHDHSQKLISIKLKVKNTFNRKTFMLVFSKNLRYFRNFSREKKNTNT